MGRIVGIDLGTTNSVVAVLEAGEPAVIPLAEGSRLCPSVVGFTREGERLVGELAKRQAVTNPERTFASVKRFMGTDQRFYVDERAYSVPELSALVLRKLKIDAEAYLGERITRAVITVPAYFNDGQRQATKDAGQIAGLEVLRIINEPTAAALAYGLDKTDAQTILVWDLGGGTFDVSILVLGEGNFDVKATCGDTRLGGDDWDSAVVEWLLAEFWKRYQVDLRQDRLALQRLREAAESAKIELSTQEQTKINLPFLHQGAAGGLHLERTLTRTHFEELTAALLERMREPTYQALNDARLAPQQLDKIILVGGSTRMPAVQALVRELFQKEPYLGMNPDEVVAAGAAIQAGILAGELSNLVLLDVTPLSLGIETLGGVTTRLIPRNTTIPTRRTEVFTTAVESQSSVEVHILQGEREMAADNKTLAKFLLSGIDPAPRGVPQIEVLFDIDVNGILSVSARDKATGREQAVLITAASGLAPEEVNRMVAEAAAHAQSDLERRTLEERRNQAEATLYQAERYLPFLQQTEGVTGAQLEGIYAAIRGLHSVLQTQESTLLSEKTAQLHTALQTLRHTHALPEETELPWEPALPEESTQEKEVRAIPQMEFLGDTHANRE